MIILNKFDEFGKEMGFPSMREFFAEEKYENQQLIADYLKNGTPTMASTAVARDVFTGERIGREQVFMNDGIYSWVSDLAYYVEKYNLKLPDDFVDHVINRLTQK